MMPLSLEELDLSGEDVKPHKFTAGIPPESGSLTNLKKLRMQECGWDSASRGLTRHTARTFCQPCLGTGPLPAGLSQLTNLQRLDVSVNELSGAAQPGIPRVEVTEQGDCLHRVVTEGTGQADEPAGALLTRQRA